MRIITFLSDFGTRDWFVAAVKGEILKLAPDASIVDITHDIAPYDVRGAAFVLAAVFTNFPSGTIHLAVVDPGVGSERKPLIIESRGYSFVGPDNGIFSYVYDRGARVYEIISGPEASSTFHARDIFGPAAARLAAGTPLDTVAEITEEFTRIARPRLSEKNGVLDAEIVYIDRFGNCITSIPVQRTVTSVRVGDKVMPVKRNYGEGKPGELIVVRGSSGYYEIACNEGRACEQLHAATGMAVQAS